MNALLHDFSFRVPNKGKEDAVHDIFDIYHTIQCGNNLLLSNYLLKTMMDRKYESNIQFIY